MDTTRNNEILNKTARRAALLMASLAVVSACSSTAESGEVTQEQTPVTNETVSESTTSTADATLETQTTIAGEITGVELERYLNPIELTERIEQVTLGELIVAPEEDGGIYSAEKIIDDWSYKFSLYVNIGYGDKDMAIALFNDIEGPVWEGFTDDMIKYSKDLGDVRWHGENSARWDFFSLKHGNFQEPSADKIQFEGTLLRDSTEDDHQDQAHGIYTFVKSAFVIDGQEYVGWRLARDF